MTEVNEGRKTREGMNFCISLLSYDKEIIENQNKLGDKKTQYSYSYIQIGHPVVYPHQTQISFWWDKDR